MSDRPAAVAVESGLVRPTPLLGAVMRVLPLWLTWLFVVVLGRGVCLLAQRIPPVVSLVRRVRAARTPTDTMRG